MSRKPLLFPQENEVGGPLKFHADLSHANAVSGSSFKGDKRRII